MSVKRVCIFAHYDKEGFIDPYVVDYIKALKPFVEKFIFVSTQLSKESAENKELKDLNVEIIIRENKGYDFYSWKIALDSVNFQDYDEILQVNDSCYGPLFEFSQIFSVMDSVKCDFWGLTKSNQIKDHIQSFFVCYKKSVVQSKEFAEFWEDLEVIPDKTELIHAYEIGLSQKLSKKGFVMKSFLKVSFSKYLQKIFQYYIEKVLKFLRKIFYFPVKMVMNIWLKIQQLVGSAPESIKEDLEETYYVHWSAIVIRIGRKMRLIYQPWRIYFALKNIMIVNPSHFYFKEMLEQKIPVIKVELIRDNPLGIPEVSLRQVEAVNKLTLNKIKEHQYRVGSKKAVDKWIFDVE